MDLISVIIPIYNNEKYLASCLDSVVNQTFSNLEIILVNDGSTDNSEIICNEYKTSDKRIQVIHQSNQGVSAARNTGLKLAKGEYISFIDADDKLDSDMYYFLYNLIKKYNADIVHCGYRHIVGDEVRLIHDTKKIYKQTKDEALECLIGGKLFVGALWNKLYSKKIIQNLSFKDDIKINEDILFNFYAFRNTKMTIFADYAMYNYIAHKNSSACFTTAIEKKYKDVCEVSRYIYKELRETSLATISAERYIRALSSCYRIEKNNKHEIRREIISVNNENDLIGKNSKRIVFLIKYLPMFYNFIYVVYDKIRKPNWEV